MDQYLKLKLENQLCFPLYAAARQVVNLYNPAFKPLGLTYTEYIVFMVLWEKDDITVGDLGEKLYLNNSTLTPLLKRMESNGYITKSRELSDERIVKIRLTSKGWEMREKAATIPDSMKNCISLSPEKAGQLYTLLYELLDDIKEHQIEHV